MEYLQSLQFTNEIWYILIPVLLEALDVITGYTNAWVHNDVKSWKMREGIGKKVGELVYVTVGVLSKEALGTSVIMIFLTIYISFMEVISLFENCAKLGVPIPKEIKDKLNLKEEEKKND